MLDVSFGEMLLVCGIAIIAIPPKDWPATLRAVGKALGQVKHWGAEARFMFQQLSEEGKDALPPSASGMIRDLEGKWRETYDLSDFIDASRPVRHGEEAPAEPPAESPPPSEGR